MKPVIYTQTMVGHRICGGYGEQPYCRQSVVVLDTADISYNGTTKQ